MAKSMEQVAFLSYVTMTAAMTVMGAAPIHRYLIFLAIFLARR